ncbi:MAG: S26 family signal peptidase [Cuniculiplasma sp.]
MKKNKLAGKLSRLVLYIFPVILIVSITLYAGMWPPFSVVESNSMEHSGTFQFGTIETGSTVIVKHPSGISSITTYVQGRETGFMNYGDYGNVILYVNYAGTLVIHRAMFYLQWNSDKPSILGYTNQSWLTLTPYYVVIQNVGPSHRNLCVNISSFRGVSGFITMGDHNLINSTLQRHMILGNNNSLVYLAADQNVLYMSNGTNYRPVNISQVYGIAVGNLPLIGIYKLYILGAEGQWHDYNLIPTNSNYYLAAFTIFLLGIPASIWIIGKKRKKSGS